MAEKNLQENELKNEHVLDDTIEREKKVSLNDVESDTPSVSDKNADVVADESKEINLEQDAGNEANEKKKKVRKKILAYVSFILINVLVIGGFLLFEDKTGDLAIGNVAFSLLGENWTFTLLAVSMFFVIILCDIVVFYSLTYKMKIKKSLGVCVNVSFFGRYYDRVTPWAMGGEPFQIAYLCKRGLNVGQSGAVTMSRHIIRFFSVAIAVIIILVASRIVTNVAVMVVAILSVLGGLIVPTFMLICSWKPKVGHKISRSIISLLAKIKIVKDKEKACNKIDKSVEEFLVGIKFLSANKILIVIITVCSLTEMFAYNSVPFFVMKALGVQGVEYWHTLVLCLFVNYASSFAPTPGGAGIAELSFYAIFASFIGDGLLFWAVLFWRIAVFYIPVFIGFCMQVTTCIKDIVLAKRSLR